VTRRNDQHLPRTTRGGNHAPERGPSDPHHELLALASQAEARGRIDEALVCYRQIVATDPGHPAANLKLATADSACSGETA